MSDYTEVELVSQKVVFSDDAVLENLAFGNEFLEESFALEKWDGTNWRSLYTTEEISQEEIAELFTWQINGDKMDINVADLCGECGIGLYRIVREGTDKDSGERLYPVIEIKVLDVLLLNKKKELATVLAEAIQEESPTSITLQKGGELILLEEEMGAALWDYLMQMQCVGTITNFLSPLGSESSGYVLVAEFGDDKYITVRNQSGKDLDGNEYSAVCTVPGMQTGLLLYDKDGTWLDELLKYLEK
ncbi:MAG: hypothetical protein J1E83_05350 [Lachnospiraceae bacterium]|nr:hypothetical protein [Lachnospiraceae bacterium]